MGNESSTDRGTKVVLTREEFYYYQKELSFMKQQVVQKDDRIFDMKVEGVKTNKMVQDFHSRLLEAVKSKQSVTENLEAVKAEKNNLHEMIENLRKQLEEKDIEMKKKLAEANKIKKTTTKELNKYKSMKEFEALMKLNADLVDFQAKIESILANDCGLYQLNDDDREIEMIKRKNAEFYGLLKDNNIKTLVTDKFDLKKAENELNKKKELVKKEFLTINGKLTVIKDKMAQGTKKFAGTFENAIGELQKNLQTNEKEVIGLEESKKQIKESISYVEIKNILLQQQNEFMAEMIASNISLPSNSKSQIPKIHNDFSTTQKKLSDDDVDIFDDDTNSISNKEKEFKLILHNVEEEGEKSDCVKVRNALELLTNLSLNDIEIRRLGKPTGKLRPILIGFDSIVYVRQILKKRHLLKNSKFDMMRVCPYVHKQDSNKQKMAFDPS